MGHPDEVNDAVTPSAPVGDAKTSAIHDEKHGAELTAAGWKISKTGDGDTAMALFNDPDELEEEVDKEEIRRLVRKIDWQILPYLLVCYCFFYIDKTTLSYAAIFGIQKDLKLHGTQYSWLSSVFYFGFLAWAIPTNLLLQKYPIGKYLGTQIFLWGALLMCQAACNNFHTLALCRALAGAAEAAADPCFMVITQMWYTRRQQPIRLGVWYTGYGFGAAAGGLLGYAIGHIGGSLPSWKYEFIIIGALCCVWGIVMFIVLPDSPVTAPRFTPRERRIAVERLRINQTGVENKHFKWYQVREMLTDVKTPLFFMIGLVGTIPNGGISNFGTIIVKGFGYSTLLTTVLQVPYGISIAMWIWFVCWANDKMKNKRCMWLIISVIPNIAGAFGLRFVPLHQHVARLFMYYLTGPYNAAFAMILSLSMANTAGHTKKIMTNAMLFLGYCTGNLSGPFFYKITQSPTYPLGMWSMIVCHLLEICCALGFWYFLSKENKRRDALQGVVDGGVDDRDLDATAFSDMTDRENLNFRYVY